EFAIDFRKLKGGSNVSGLAPRILGYVFHHQKRKVGSLIAHSGMALAFLAFVGAAFQEESIVQLSANESHSFKGYDVFLRQVQLEPHPHKTFARAYIDVCSTHRLLGTLAPAGESHLESEQPTTEADVLVSPTDDLYVIMGTYDATT